MSSRVFAASGAKSPKKQEYFKKLIDLCEKHPQILIVEADNVGSRQMAEVRLALRGRATVLMGKNTMIRTCLRRKLGEMPQLQALIDLMQANVGMVFCEDSPAAIRKVVLEHKVPAPAKQGAVAPCDVTIPAGPTGMDPGQTSFFQALGIATKIVKSQIEIQGDVNLIKAGDRVTASQAVLLERLNIRPFAYGLKCPTVYDAGAVYPASVLDISTDDVVTAIKAAVGAAAALSLGADIPTAASVPHLIVNAFRKACGVAMACELEIPELEALKNAAAAAPAAAAVPAAAVEKAEEKVEEKEESEDEDMGFSLFD